MKEINPNAKPFLFAFAFFLLLVLIIFLNSCTSPARKLQKSYMNVLSDSAKMEDMRVVVQRLWPCIPAIGKPGKTITVVNTVEDTMQINELKRKLNSIIFVPTMNIDSIKQSIISQIHPLIIHTNSIRVDTVPDTQAIQLMQSRVDAAKQAENTANGQIISKDKQIQATQSDANKWRMYAIGTWSLLGVILGISVYLKFFTPSGATGSVIQKFFNKK